MFKKLLPLIVITLALLSLASRAEAATVPLSGYAWNPNIGWISFSNNNYPGPAYGVNLLSESGGSGYRSLQGWAWNPTIGWIKFDPTFLGPNATDNYGAKMNTSTGLFSGWARACIVLDSSNCIGNTLKADIITGGWDGWIKFASNGDAGGSYAAAADSGPSPTRFLNSYAWDKYLGWISFCNPSYPSPDGGSTYCVYFNKLTISCQAGDGTGTSQISQGIWVNWRGTVSGGTSPYSMSWTDTGNGGPVGTSNSGNSWNRPTPAAGGYDCPLSVPNNPSGKFSVSDYVGATAECSASTILVCGIPPPPTGGDLTGGGNTITITSQPLTSVAISSGTSLNNQAPPVSGNNATVSIQSSDSVLGGHSLAIIPEVRCRLATSTLPPDLSGFGSCDSSNSVTVLPGGSLFLNIKVSGSAPPALNQYNPYKIVLVNATFCMPDPLGGPCVPTSQTQNVFFDYAVGTVNPI